ncbi:MAG: hypothetical protein QM776_01445 [Rhodocyclaceae bacterium]
MEAVEGTEACPSCASTDFVRSKLLLIDEAWAYVPGADPRHAYFASLRVDDVKKEFLKESPLEQFIDGYYCDKCGRGFVTDAILNPEHRQYR